MTLGDLAEDAGEGGVVDMPYLPRAAEGTVRLLLVGATVVKARVELMNWH